MSLFPCSKNTAMGDNTKLQQLQAKLDDVAKQIIKVLANSTAVEAAIAGNGTYRGYSGEDVFLKHNLWAVQKEMMKELRRQERKLEKQKAQLLQQTSPAVGGEDPPSRRDSCVSLKRLAYLPTDGRGLTCCARAVLLCAESVEYPNESNGLSPRLIFAAVK